MNLVYLDNDELAQKAIEGLKEEGIEVIQWDGQSPIEKVIVLVSEAANADQEIQERIHLMLKISINETRAKVIPCLLDQENPESIFLEGRNGIKLDEENYAGQIKELARSIKGKRKRPPKRGRGLVAPK